MNTLQIQLPDWLEREIRRIAEDGQMSIDQVVVSALAEKLSAMKSTDYLESRAKRGDRKKFLEVLRKVPDVEPDPDDRID